MNPSRIENPVASTPNTPGRAIAVLEEAALRRAAAHEQQRCDRDPARHRDDEEPPDDVHQCTVLGHGRGGITHPG